MTPRIQRYLTKQEIMVPSTNPTPSMAAIALPAVCASEAFLTILKDTAKVFVFSKYNVKFFYLRVSFDLAIY